MKNKESSRKYQGEKYQGKHEKHKKKRISRSDLKDPLSYFFRAFREFRVWDLSLFFSEFPRSFCVFSGKKHQREIMFAHEVKLYMRDIPLPAAKNRKNGISVQISEAADLTKMIPRRNTGR